MTRAEAEHERDMTEPFRGWWKDPDLRYGETWHEKDNRRRSRASMRKQVQPGAVWGAYRDPRCVNHTLWVVDFVNAQQQRLQLGVYFTMKEATAATVQAFIDRAVEWRAAESERRLA